MGRKRVAAQALEYLLTLPDVHVVGVLTDSHFAFSPTTDVAKRHAIPLYEFSAALTALKEGTLAFDLGVSMLYWRKLREEFLLTPSRGAINFHPAPLPEYKGTGGYNLAILERKNTWAASAHYMDHEIDTGGIIKVSEFPIDAERETAQSLEQKTQPVLYALFKEVFDAARLSKERLVTVSNIGGRYVSRAEMEAMKEIKSSDDIPRKIRAFWFPPYDGAYQLIGNRKFTLVDRFILEQLADPSMSSLFMENKC
ncbi:MAG TPA: formyltransferase family protein [Noviherbaspirillum sp.]